MHNHHHHEHNSTKNIKVAFILNFSFAVLEIIGGFLTNSMAILSDAMHDLGDSLSLGSAWFLERYSKKKADKNYTYGYSRFSILGALINSVILITGSILIVVNAIPRVINPEPVNEKGMIIFAIAGILINGFAVIRLKKGSSLSEKVVSWHLLEDVFGWVAVLIVSIIMIYKKIPVLDPILSLGITIYITYNVIKNLSSIINIFLEGVPAKYSIDKIESRIKETVNIVDVYHTHIWSLDGIRDLLSTHVLVDDSIHNDEIINIKNSIRNLIENMGIHHVTVQVDYKKENVSMNMHKQ